MSIYKSAIDKPVTTILIFLGVIVIGLYSLVQLPIDQYPEIDPPYITVMTTYSGASASEVETNVTKVLENSLNSVDGLKEMTSQSKDNMSMITLEFNWGKPLDEVINDVRSYIDMAKTSLPDGCDNPFIFKLSSSMIPVMQYAFTAKESYMGLDKILNDDVLPQLNRVDGVGNISISGAPERYIYVNIDQAKLDAYGIPLEKVASAISSNNLNLSAGTVKMKKDQYQLEVRSEYAESSDIDNVVVTTTPSGKQVFVKDIAQVKDTLKDLTLDEKINGQTGVRLVVMKQSGANTVKICQNLRKKMAEVEKTLPSDVKEQVIYDSSTTILNSIHSLEDALKYALIFVVLVVLFFLGKWRATLIIAITIPISLIVSFVYLGLSGGTLNIISLSSLSVAIGMVVDDAIVVLENITRHIERGSNPREAAIYATNEVWIAVIATTLVIAAVFVPLTMLGGEAGIMFKQLGWIVTITVGASTTIAISLTPMLASKILKAKKVHVDENGALIEKEEKQGWYQRTVMVFLGKVDKAYAKLLRFALHHKALTLISILVFFILSLIPAFMGKIGFDFMQKTDNGRLTVTAELNVGTRIDETLKTARALEAQFMKVAPEIKIISTSAGSNDEAGISSLFSSTTNSKISMIIVLTDKNKRKRSVFEVAEALRKVLATHPEIIESQCAVSSHPGGSSSTLDVEIYGYDFDQTNVMAKRVMELVQDSVKGARDVHINRDRDRSEITLIFNKQKLGYYGLNSATVATYIRNRVNGENAGYFKQDGDEYNIVVRLKDDDRNSITDIANLTIPTATGKSIKVSEVAKIKDYWEPPTIDRKSRQRYVDVQITPYKVSMGVMAENVKLVLKNIDMPQGIHIQIAGEYEDMQETYKNMFLLLIMIILLVYIVMASQFESYSKPFIIMFSVFFALSGTILALWITGTSLDMVGALGFIMLVGIAVKNGIVLVDYTNLMRDRGYELYDAIALSGASRLRPVLMTATTTLLGMLPMALSTGEGSEMWRPMGIVVIGGLFVSTVVTLIIVPVLYSIFSRHGERNKEEHNERNFFFMKIKVDKKNEDKRIYGNDIPKDVKDEDLSNYHF